jgi:hypothetical protein
MSVEKPNRLIEPTAFVRTAGFHPATAGIFPFIFYHFTFHHLVLALYFVSKLN